VLIAKEPGLFEMINRQGSKQTTKKVAEATKKVLGDKTHCLFSHLAIQFMNYNNEAFTKTTTL